MYVFVYVCTYAFIYLYMHVCMFLLMCVCVCVCACVRVYSISTKSDPEVMDVVNGRMTRLSSPPQCPQAVSVNEICQDLGNCMFFHLRLIRVINVTNVTDDVGPPCPGPSMATMLHCR